MNFPSCYGRFKLSYYLSIDESGENSVYIECIRNDLRHAANVWMGSTFIQSTFWIKK